VCPNQRVQRTRIPVVALHGDRNGTTEPQSLLLHPGEELPVSTGI